MVAGLAMAACAQAQTAPASALTVIPPPAIDAPGAKPVPAQATSTPAKSALDISVPALPSGQTGATVDRRGDAPPTVKVATHDGKVIEQYYDGGQLYMVRVHPKHGVPYSYYVHKGRKLDRGPGAPPVSPVLYTILKWGQPSSSSDGDSQ